MRFETVRLGNNHKAMEYLEMLFLFSAFGLLSFSAMGLAESVCAVNSELLFRPCSCEELLALSAAERTAKRKFAARISLFQLQRELNLTLNEISEKLKHGLSLTDRERLLAANGLFLKKLLKKLQKSVNLFPEVCEGGRLLSLILAGSKLLSQKTDFLPPVQQLAAILLIVNAPQTAYGGELIAYCLKLLGKAEKDGRFDKVKDLLFYKVLQKNDAAYLEGDKISLLLLKDRILLKAFSKTLGLTVQNFFPVRFGSNFVDFSYNGNLYTIKTASCGGLSVSCDNLQKAELLLKALAVKILSSGLFCEIVEGDNCVMLLLEREQKPLFELKNLISLSGQFAFYQQSKEVYSTKKLYHLLLAENAACTNDRLLFEGAKLENIDKYNLFQAARVVLVAKDKRYQDREVQKLHRLNRFLIEFGKGFSVMEVENAAENLSKNALMVLRCGKYYFQNFPALTQIPLPCDVDKPMECSLDRYFNIDKLCKNKRFLKSLPNFTDSLKESLLCLFELYQKPENVKKRLLKLFSNQRLSGGIASRFSGFAQTEESRFATLFCVFTVLCYLHTTADFELLNQKILYTEVDGENGLGKKRQIAASDTFLYHIISAFHFCLFSEGEIHDGEIFRYLCGRSLKLCGELSFPEDCLQKFREGCSALDSVKSNDSTVSNCYDSVLSAKDFKEAAKNFYKCVELISFKRGLKKSILSALLENCYYSDMLGLTLRGKMLGCKPSVLLKNGITVNYNGVKLTVKKGAEQGIKIGSIFYRNLHTVSLENIKEAEIVI